jgi:hypothetical protein
VADGTAVGDAGVGVWVAVVVGGSVDVGVGETLDVGVGDVV